MCCDVSGRKYGPVGGWSLGRNYHRLLRLVVSSERFNSCSKRNAPRNLHDLGSLLQQSLRLGLLRMLTSSGAHRGSSLLYMIITKGIDLVCTPCVISPTRSWTSFYDWELTIARRLLYAYASSGCQRGELRDHVTSIVVVPRPWMHFNSRLFPLNFLYMVGGRRQGGSSQPGGRGLFWKAAALDWDILWGSQCRLHRYGEYRVMED